jgi:hypothetical protein
MSGSLTGHGSLADKTMHDAKRHECDQAVEGNSHQQENQSLALSRAREIFMRLEAVYTTNYRDSR